MRQYMGDTRGRWEGDTLVLDTTNLTDKTGVGANGRALFHSAAMRLTERFTRTAADTLQYTVTIDDPQLWTRPWTMSFPLTRDDGYGMFGYRTYEGNYGLRNMRARANVAAAADSAGRRVLRLRQGGRDRRRVGAARRVAPAARAHAGIWPACGVMS